MPIQTSRGPALLPPCHDLMIHLARFPIPEAHVPGTITGRDKLAVRRDRQINSITRVIVAAETLLAVLSELIGRAVHDNLVIARLKGDVFAVGMGRCARESEHVRLCNELDWHGDTVFPGAKGLIVGCGDEAAVLVDEGECVDGRKVVVVFLDLLAGAGIELDDLLVRHTSEELVGVFGIGVEADDMRGFAG